MSFDIYVQSFENGLPVGIPLELVRQIFGSHLSELEPDYWTLSFDPSESCSVFPSVQDDSPHVVQSLSIGNPCDTPMLWDGLFSLLGFGNTVLHFPGCSGPLVLEDMVACQIPHSMLESRGSPIIVRSGQDIRHLVLAA
jgi:hypothetical protein